MIMLLHFLIQGICIGFLYALAALGFVMIFKSSSVLNFAHGELLAFGAFLFLVLSSWTGLPIPIALAFTLMGSFALGFIIERLFLRPLIGEALIQVIMLTVGLASMFKGFLLFVFGGDLHSYPRFLPQSLAFKLGPVYVSPAYTMALITTITFLVLFGLFFKYSFSRDLYAICG